MGRPTYMTINLAALSHNLERIRKLTSGRKIMAMVKANAYGHGIVRVAHALSSADALGVASLEEGIMLREAGISQPIVLMEGLFHPNEIQEVIKHHFTLVVHHEPHIEMLEKAQTADQSISVWLKINTGMHRLGIPPEKTSDFFNRLLKVNAIHKPIGLMTHFAQADADDRTPTLEQIACFNKAITHLSGETSLANSAAILAWPEAHGDWVRPGLILYGASPFQNKTGLDHDLQPVMTLSSRLIAITPVKKGGKVGYGGTWSAPRDMLIGVVGVGYGDGYPQFATNGTPILVNGKECELIGRVSMDMLTVNLEKQPEAKIGDPVVLWGEGLPVERVARASHTSSYEILTRMTPRPKIDIITRSVSI